MPYLSRVLSGAASIFRAELALFRRFPRMRAAVAGIAFVPALYALIYLSSVWDPASKAVDLPAAIVNQDRGFEYQGHQAQVGADLTATLLRKQTFGFREMGEPEAARRAVREGRLAFALLIPPDFSATAVPGSRAGAGQLVVYTSEGNNYSSAGFARRFAAELSHQVNETLNEQRWALVLQTAAGSQESVGRLREGLSQLRQGVTQLADGSQKYSQAADQLGGGFKQVGAGVRLMDSKRPADADLQALKNGSQALANGQRELGKGLEALQQGAGKLADGAGQLRTEGGKIPFYGSKVAQAAGELGAGAGQLGQGLGKAREANTQLATGATTLDGGVGRLTEGMRALGDGLHTLAERLPSDHQLDEFTQGGQRLAQGAARLRAGVELIYSAVPASVARLEGSARGLANSVEPRVEVDAPVPNNGSAFAPNMVAVALWVGAVMLAYLFNMRTLMVEHGKVPRLGQALGKYAVPALMLQLQVLLMLATLIWLLDVPVRDLFTLALTLSAASLVFFAMVFALLRVFGEAGKLLAVLLLTLQLASGGGVLPIELSDGFFRAVHHWLPFTWVVQAFRASLFGAFDNAWGPAWLLVGLSGVVALGIATLVGRWKLVTLENYQPGIDV